MLPPQGSAADQCCEICMCESERIVSSELKQEADFTKSESHCPRGLLKSFHLKQWDRGAKHIIKAGHIPADLLGGVSDQEAELSRSICGPQLNHLVDRLSEKQSDGWIGRISPRIMTLTTCDLEVLLRTTPAFWMTKIEVRWLRVK